MGDMEEFIVIVLTALIISAVLLQLLGEGVLRFTPLFAIVPLSAAVGKKIIEKSIGKRLTKNFATYIGFVGSVVFGEWLNGVAVSNLVNPSIANLSSAGLDAVIILTIEISFGYLFYRVAFFKT